MVTIKTLADELSISKVAINNRINKAGLKSQLIKQGNTYLIPDEIADELRSIYTAKAERQPEHTQKKNGKADDNVISVLSRQLEEKDKQIEALTSMLETSQEQILRLTQSIQQSNYLLADSMGVSDKASAPDQEEPAPAEKEEETPGTERKGFLRWFK